ncbi:MAG: hypothetical protein H7338_07340 [Candidatus Sericytochromatia bacterium]|nr:hypothetical protein [Candidatus Sericytochromatia bacterium]
MQKHPTPPSIGHHTRPIGRAAAILVTLVLAGCPSSMNLAAPGAVPSAVPNVPPTGLVPLGMGPWDTLFPTASPLRTTIAYLLRNLQAMLATESWSDGDLALLAAGSDASAGPGYRDLQKATLHGDYPEQVSISQNSQRADASDGTSKATIMRTARYSPFGTSQTLTYTHRRVPHRPLGLVVDETGGTDVSGSERKARRFKTWLVGDRYTEVYQIPAPRRQVDDPHENPITSIAIDGGPNQALSGTLTLPDGRQATIERQRSDTGTRVTAAMRMEDLQAILQVGSDRVPKTATIVQQGGTLGTITFK